MDVWNKREIPRPPVFTLEYSPLERVKTNLDVCIQILLESLVGGHAVLSDEEVSSSFQREVAILAASLYQNGRHRTEKFFRILKKVQKCGEQWQGLGLSSTLGTVRHLMPAVPPTHRGVRLPSRQMFVYLVVRIMGGWHLLQRLDGYCKEAASYLMTKVSSGHFFCTAMAFLANTARIRALSVDLCEQLASVYNTILPCLHQLKSTNASDLVPLTSLPSSLHNHQCLKRKAHSTGISNNNNSIYLREAKPKASVFTALEEVDNNGGNGSTIKLYSCNKEHKPSILPDEDIGMCVEEMRHTITSDIKAKKRKREKGKVVSDSAEKNKISTLSAPKRVKKNKSEGSKPGKEKLLSDHKGGITKAFASHYKLVKAATTKMNSLVDIRVFLKVEQNKRINKNEDRLSLLLKKKDWITLKKFLLKYSKQQRQENDLTSAGDTQEDQLCKIKMKLKFWLLYPQLKGKKPQDWNVQLKDINCMKKRI